MNSSNGEESNPLPFTSGSPTVVRDTRSPFKKKLAVYLLLGSVFFETFAFYTIDTNLIAGMMPDPSYNWQPAHILIALFIYTGNRISSSSINEAILVSSEYKKHDTISLE